MTKAELKRVERLHLLRTLFHYGPASAVEVCRRANTECDGDERFDELPEIKPRGITMKLNGLSVAGLVKGRYPGGGEPMLWELTERGRGKAVALEETQ